MITTKEDYQNRFRVIDLSILFWAFPTQYFSHQYFHLKLLLSVVRIAKSSTDGEQLPDNMLDWY